MLTSWRSTGKDVCHRPVVTKVWCSAFHYSSQSRSFSCKGTASQLATTSECGLRCQVLWHIGMQ